MGAHSLDIHSIRAYWNTACTDTGVSAPPAVIWGLITNDPLLRLNEGDDCWSETEVWRLTKRLYPYVACSVCGSSLERGISLGLVLHYLLCTQTNLINNQAQIPRCSLRREANASITTWSYVSICWLKLCLILLHENRCIYASGAPPGVKPSFKWGHVLFIRHSALNNSPISNRIFNM